MHKRTTRMAIVLGAIALLGVPVACDDDAPRFVDIADETPGVGNVAGGGERDAAAVDSAVADAGSDALALSADEIARVLLGIHESALAQADLVLQRAASNDVRVFADRLSNVHAEGVQRLRSLTQAAPSPVLAPSLAEAFARRARAVTNDLATLAPGQELDFGFIASRIASSAEALALLDRMLQPSIARLDLEAAASAALVAELSRLRGILENDLAQALEIARSLSTRSVN